MRRGRPPKYAGLARTSSAIFRRSPRPLAARRTRRPFRPSKVRGSALDHLLLLQFLNDQFHHAIDGLLGGRGVEGVADGGPYQFALWAAGGVQVGLDANFLFLAQVARRIDLLVDGSVIAIETSVVRVGEVVGLTGNVLDIFIDLHQPGNDDAVDLVGAHLGLDVVEIHGSPFGAQ